MLAAVDTRLHGVTTSRARRLLYSRNDHGSEHVQRRALLFASVASTVGKRCDENDAHGVLHEERLKHSERLAQ